MIYSIYFRLQGKGTLVTYWLQARRPFPQLLDANQVHKTDSQSSKFSSSAIEVELEHDKNATAKICHKYNNEDSEYDSYMKKNKIDQFKYV